MRIGNIFSGLLIVGFLTGCSYFSNLFEYRVPLEKVHILVDKHANDTMAVAVDLVVVCDEELDAELKKMTAAEFFEKKEDLLMSDSDRMLVWHWEVVPGQKLKNLPIDFNEFDPTSGYVFAFYRNGYPNRVKVPDVKEIKIVLGKERVRLLKVTPKDD